ncbi:sigma-70 family RNA polymerase sigma factor [soil metagenome]
MALTTVDRDLLTRCLKKQPGSWNDFVDRFLSLFYHVIHSTAHLRSAKLNSEDIEDIAAEILLQIVTDDYKVLRQFKGQASLATYMTVIARRISVHEITKRQAVKDAVRKGLAHAPIEDDEPASVMKSIERLDEVDRLVRKLSGREREIVRLYYLEGRTYEEISTETGVAVNTIGSVLSRARTRLRQPSASNDQMPAVSPAPVRKSSGESKAKFESRRNLAK